MIGDPRHSDEGGNKQCGFAGRVECHDANYNGYNFPAEAVRLIDTHDQSKPFFLYFALRKSAKRTATVVPGRVLCSTVQATTTLHDCHCHSACLFTTFTLVTILQTTRTPRSKHQLDFKISIATNPAGRSNRRSMPWSALWTSRAGTSPKL